MLVLQDGTNLEYPYRCPVIVYSYSIPGSKKEPWTKRWPFPFSTGYWALKLNGFLKTLSGKTDSSLIQFSHSVMSDSLRPHGLQHARPPVHHQLPEFTQTHVHWVSDAIQPSHPLLSPSPPAFNLSQHQGLFKWVSSSHQVAKVLEWHRSFQWIFRTDFL